LKNFIIYSIITGLKKNDAKTLSMNTLRYMTQYNSYSKMTENCQLGLAHTNSISYFDLTVISTVLYSGRHKLLMYCIPTIPRNTVNTTDGKIRDSQSMTILIDCRWVNCVYLSGYLNLYNNAQVSLNVFKKTHNTYINEFIMCNTVKQSWNQKKVDTSHHISMPVKLRPNIYTYIHCVPEKNKPL